MTTTSATNATTKRTGWAWALGTFFGAGLIKPGPGTWGSVAAVILWFAAAKLAHPSTTSLRISTIVAAAVATVAGIAAASIVEKESGREDPQHVVIDEVAGQWITLILCPVDLAHAALGLALFRLFDILKPPPARQLESLHGGLGIMMDDVAAGFYGLLVFAMIMRFWH
ncbi:phosphatidylglycerophosphatase A family protein [Silvibacterium acidisoli]|uniref:phosphatidylglycerophosphatase A family protein n=1 Tax=Acidobacteriaceae bacterium ZG23-2 TaxID=2883246 RepID=UPI00406C0ACC